MPWETQGRRCGRDQLSLSHAILFGPRSVTPIKVTSSTLNSVLGFPIYDVAFLLSCVGSRHTYPLRMSAKFFSATNCISSDPIDHTRGRASIVDGSIIYSPNCGRTVKTPPMSPHIPLLISTGEHVDILHRPLWWSQETAFLAFLPINPNFAGVPFEEFDTAELRSGLTGYFMQGDAFLKWKQTESLLQALIQSFANTYEHDISSASP